MCISTDTIFIWLNTAAFISSIINAASIQTQPVSHLLNAQKQCLSSQKK